MKQLLKFFLLRFVQGSFWLRHFDEKRRWNPTRPTTKQASLSRTSLFSNNEENLLFDTSFRSEGHRWKSTGQSSTWKRRSPKSPRQIRTTHGRSNNFLANLIEFQFFFPDSRKHQSSDQWTWQFKSSLWTGKSFNTNKTNQLKYLRLIMSISYRFVEALCLWAPHFITRIDVIQWGERIEWERPTWFSCSSIDVTRKFIPVPIE